MPPLHQQLFEQGLIETNSFSFYLTKNHKNGSKLILGGTKKELAKEPFKYY